MKRRAFLSPSKPLIFGLVCPDLSFGEQNNTIEIRERDKEVTVVLVEFVEGMRRRLLKLIERTNVFLNTTKKTTQSKDDLVIECKKIAEETAVFFETGIFGKQKLTRDSYYRGLVISAVCSILRSLKTDLPGFRVDAMKHLKVAAQSNHPGAMFLLAGAVSGDVGKNKMKDAILAGSVDALAQMSGAMTRPVFNWMDQGPDVNFFKHHAEALHYWLVTYFYMVRYDPLQKYIALRFPDDGGTWAYALDPEITGNFKLQRIADIIEFARPLSAKISTDYRWEEVCTFAWLNRYIQID
jgi:hypothetical protein